MIEGIKDVLWIIATLLGTYKTIHEIRKSKKDIKKKKRPNRNKRKGRKH